MHAYSGFPVTRLSYAVSVSSVPREEWRQYGTKFLSDLEEDHDWRSIDALWRFGGPADMTDVARVMARSGDARLAWLLAKGLVTGCYVEQTPTLPEILYEDSPTVSGPTAAEVLERLLSEEEPLKAPYADKPHLIVAWLMRQPGTVLDDLAVDIVVGDHPYSEVAGPKKAALDRIAQSSELGSRVIQRFLDDSERWATGTSWTRTADVVARIGNPKGRAALVRAMTIALLRLPPEEAVQPSAEFTALMEKHAAGELASALGGEPLAITPGTSAAVRAVAAFKPGKGREDLVEALADRQQALWSPLRSDVYSAWSAEEWSRMLARWSVPDSHLLDAGEVIDAAPAETNVARIRVAVVHRTEPGDYAARVAQGALKVTVATDDDSPRDVPAVVAAVPWDLVESEDAERYLDWILRDVLTAPDLCAVLMHAFASGKLSATSTAALMPDDQCVAAFGHLDPGPARGEFAKALYEQRDAEFIRPVLREVIDASNNNFDVIEAIAALDCLLAFESFDEERWHDLDAAQKDRLLDLLEAHATLDQEPLLDTIANDSDGPNAPRRARAARRWAALTPIHSMIPPGILSLLESSQEPLIQAFAEIAASVQPRDEGTLVSLQDKWLNGGKTGASARAALDNVAAGIVRTLTDLRPPERREQCPPLMRLLGITAAPQTFDTLISYVGADAVDDNVVLRRAAAAAIRAFVNVTRLSGDQLDALGARLATETDPTATDDLRNALAAADLGDDAAILGLYALAGLNPDAVGSTPDELFASEKLRLLTALKKMRVQEALGEPGWDGYVEQMDLVGEALVRTAYVRFGPSDKVKKQILANRHNEPDYGNLVKAIGQAAGFGPISANLQTIHNMRTTQTAAHFPSGGALDDGAVTQAENALRTAARDILDRLLNDSPVLRAVPNRGEADQDVS